MKRIVKSIISWLCVLVMTISMATPVAAVTYNGGTSEGSGANYPIVEAISYRTTSEGYIPSVSKGSAPVEFTLYLKNNGNSTATVPKSFSTPTKCSFFILKSFLKHQLLYT